MPTAAPPLVFVGVVHLAPIGPAIATRDEIPDPQRLSPWLEVNGERQQQGSTPDMLFGVARLMAYLSELFTLEPGDLIAAGTPPGSAWGAARRRFLRPGDRVRACVAARSSRSPAAWARRRARTHLGRAAR